MTLVKMLIPILSSVSLHLNKLIKLVSESFSKPLERELQTEKFLWSSQEQGKSGYKVSCREATHGPGGTWCGRTGQARSWAGDRWSAGMENYFHYKVHCTLSPFRPSPLCLIWRSLLLLTFQSFSLKMQIGPSLSKKAAQQTCHFIANYEGLKTPPSGIAPH